MDYKKQSSFGFTIVELLVVIVVIGILAAITIVSYTGISQKATAATLQSDLTNVSQQLKLYQVTNSAYPTSFDVNNCPVPVDSARCLKPSPGTSYQYYVNNNTTPQYFCTTATNNGNSYIITNDGTPVVGDCVNYGLSLRLDAGNSVSYPSPFNGTTWVDISGNSYNGTLVNGVGYSSSSGGALVFDGVDDYVQVSPIPFGTNVTVGAWLNRTGAVNTFTPLVEQGGTRTVRLVKYGDRFCFGNDSVVNNFYCTQNLFPSTNYWYYVVASFDGSYHIFVNGVEYSVTQHTGQYSCWGTNQLNIGYRPYTSTVGPFNGNISEVRIYNRPFSASEALQNFNVLKGRYGL